MELPLNIQIVYSLDKLRTQINSTVDKEVMMQTALKAIEITELIETKKEGKERILTLLKNEIRSYSKSSTTEIEVIQFQLASSILMLCLQFIEGSYDDMQALIIELRKRAA